MSKFFQFSILEFEDHLIRHPVMDRVGNVARDWFVNKGARILFLNIGPFGMTFALHSNSGKLLKEALKSARDFSVQETKEAQNAARIRDIVVRHMYSDKHWETLVALCSIPATEGKERQLTLKLEKTLQGLER